MPDRVHIHFVLDPGATRWRDIESLDEADIERAPARFVGGRNSWIAQTFLRLRSALEANAWTVTAGPDFVPGSISVAHRDDVNRFRSAAHRAFLLVVRADRSSALACDLAIAQNALRLGEHERFEVRKDGWERYADVDVALAAREELPGVLANKPATKLYNGWLSQVPVLATPEPAYRERRRAALDFIEVHDARTTLGAVDLLRANPRLFDAMVANGVERSRAFTVASPLARSRPQLPR